MPVGSQHLGIDGVDQRAVSSQHIYNSCISTQHFAASGIPTGAIADSAISSRHLATGTNGNAPVSSQHIKASAILSQHLATGSIAPVSSQHIMSSGVVGNLISDGAVNSRVIASSGVSVNNIADGVVGSRALSAGGVVPANIGFAFPVYIGFPAVSNTNGVYTRASVLSASSVNSSVGPGTNLDYPRNVIVKFTPASASSGLWSGGSIVLSGVNIVGATVSESFAVTALNTCDTAGISGTVAWAAGPQPATISFSNVSLHTASSSASSDFSFHVGFGAKVGLPYSVAHTAHVLTVIQSSATTAHTVHTGAAGTAGIEAAWAATRAHHAYVNLSKT